MKTAKERFDEVNGSEEPRPVERLRFFCSLAMNGRDWLDVEPFFEDVLSDFDDLYDDLAQLKRHVARQDEVIQLLRDETAAYRSKESENTK